MLIVLLVIHPIELIVGLSHCLRHNHDIHIEMEDFLYHVECDDCKKQVVDELD